MFEQIIARMLRAVQLDVDLYNEVEKDENATTEALIVVALTALCAAIGTALSGEGNLFSGIIWGVIGSLIGWLVSSATIYGAGVYLFGGTATIEELLRTLGYATSPGILRILTFIPVIGPLLGFVVSIWTLVTNVVATREALDVDTTKAIIISIVAFVIWMVVLTLLGGIFGIGLAGLGVLSGAFQ